jgi:hypothetical protein
VTDQLRLASKHLFLSEENDIYSKHMLNVMNDQVQRLIIARYYNSSCVNNIQESNVKGYLLLTASAGKIRIIIKMLLYTCNCEVVIEYILSQPGYSAWPIKSCVVLIRPWIYRTHCLQYFIKFTLALSPNRTVCSSLHTHWVLSVCCPFTSPLVPHFKGKRPLPGFPNYPRAKATPTRESQCNLNLLEIPPLVQICTDCNFPTDWLLLLAYIIRSRKNFFNPILFAICTVTFSKLRKQRIQWHVEECSVVLFK